jgi:hypothetical protein
MSSSTAPRSEADLDVTSFVLDTTGKLDPHIEQAIVDGEVERMIDAASTLTVTVHDPYRSLLKSGLFGSAGSGLSPIDVKLDSLYFRLVKVSKADTDLTLSFEDLEVALLRLVTRSRKVNRTDMTRAEFALSMVRESLPHAPFFCPQLHKVQPVAGQAASTRASNGTSSSPGVYSFDQLEALWIGAGGSADLAPTMAAIALAESSGRVDAVGGPNKDGSYDYGLWQINSVHGLNTQRLTSDAAYNAQAAVSIYGSQGLDAWSTYNHGNGPYRQYMQAGTAVTAAAVAAVAQKKGRSKLLPYQFQRGGTSGETETSWDALQRLASEVNWRCFVSAGTVYFCSDDDLLAQAPKLQLDETTPYVSQIDFDVDTGKNASEAQLTVRAARWAAGPGTVIELSDVGPADGLWIVADIRRSLYQRDASITLHRPTKAKPEPAATSSITSITGGSKAAQLALDGSPAAAAASGLPEPIATAYRAAQAIAAQKYPYVWGGGHGAAGTPDHGVSGHADSAGTIPVGDVGYDCSGSTSAVLAAANMGLSIGGGTLGSSGFGGWGAAGEGKYLTVWENKDHVFMVFHIPGQGDQTFTTSAANPRSGPGFAAHTTSGFIARHWPGF